MMDVNPIGPRSPLGGHGRAQGERGQKLAPPKNVCGGWHVNRVYRIRGLYQGTT